MKLQNHLARIGAVALSASALILAGTTSYASAYASTGATDRTVHHAAVTPSQQADARSYWTADRMRNAVPMDRLISSRLSSTLKGPFSAMRSSNVARGLPQIITPRAFPQRGGAWTGGGAVVKTAGRVFFRLGDRDASCSGNAVVSGNKSVVITAGHCVKYQGNWHTNWVFAPGYDNGNRPYGTWSARSTMSTPQWVASEDINYDVGAAVVGQLSGRSLTDVVGAQAIAFNQPRNQAMYAFGYPAAAPYDGTRLIYCSGNTFTDFLLSSDHGMSCNMTGGSSGGPWFLRFNESNGTGAQASVNSFGYTFLPGYMFGPYFGTDAQNLYNRAAAA